MILVYYPLTHLLTPDATQHNTTTDTARHRAEVETAACTFAPIISEQSRLLVEARERAMLGGGDLAVTGGLDLTLGEASEAWQALSPEEQLRRRKMRELVRAEAMHRVGGLEDGGVAWCVCWLVVEVGCLVIMAIYTHAVD